MDQYQSRQLLEAFIESGSEHPTLALLYGRRRIGKSWMLEDLTARRGGFYWEATRGESGVHLGRLGQALGEYLNVGRLSLETWEDAFRQLLRLGESGPVPVVIDEFGYLLEADSTLDSIVAAALGPASRRKGPGPARLILCGSAIAMMRGLMAGEAPLRGRAGREIVMQPLGFREAAKHLEPGVPLDLATRVFSVIGGVIGYATDMVDHDLPADLKDFDRWVAERVLSPAATLHHEATTLLAEDPTLSAGSPTLHHSILGAIANGSVAAGKIANRLRRSVPSLDPALKRLVEAGFVIRHMDPIRGRRPTYRLADPFLQFHYGVLEPNGALLRHRDPKAAWEGSLSATFASRVRGPVFEEQARDWVLRHAARATIGGVVGALGPSVLTVQGVERELDVVVTEEGQQDRAPGERKVLALGEAKSGEVMGMGRLRTLEQSRGSLGQRGADARLLFFAPSFSPDLDREAASRPDVELIDLERLYSGE